MELTRTVTLSDPDDLRWLNNLPEQAEQLNEELHSSLQERPQPTGPFSKDEEQQLIAYWNDLATVREIANQLNRPFNSVRNKVAQMQKKGLIRARDPKSKLPDNYIETTAGAYELPVDVVAYFVSRFGGTADKVMAQTVSACEAYVQQDGWCYYLQKKIKLTMDDSPSGVTFADVNGAMVLICKAVAGMRMSMSHKTFVDVCTHIAYHHRGGLVS